MGVKSKKKAKTRLDAYYRLAKDQGYRARSAFKLIQLNRKYDFLAKARVLVDLCAAPGGWCQVAAKYMPVGSKIVGVDLVPIAPIRGVKTFVGDITDDKTRKVIMTWLKKEPVDCVIHDGAPNVGGVWSRDLFEQNALVLAATKMACAMLKLQGWFVTKVFRSQDFHKLLWVLKQLFDKVEATKPLASRMESAEIFVVCAGYRAPKQIDAALFNAQKVFADVGAERVLTPSGALVMPKTNAPDGYDEFATVSHRVADFTAFLRASDPKAFLKSHHELRFSTDADKALLKSRSARKELVFLCADLQQVGDADLRRLLRWREQLLREQATQQLQQQQQQQHDAHDAHDADDGDADSDVDSTTAAAASDHDDDDDNDDDAASTTPAIDFDSPEAVTRIARELLEVRKRKAKEQKKRQKKLVDRKLKQIKGLINYDPNASAEHLADADGFATTTTTHDDDDDDGGNSHHADDADDANGDVEAFTVDKLALVDEREVAALLDAHGAQAHLLDSGNDALNPVVSADLTAQEDWDLGDADDATADSLAAAPHVHARNNGGDDDANDDDDDDVGDGRLVEGAEYDMDVDAYGNYVRARRSARVLLYEAGLDDKDNDDDDDGDTTTAAAAKTTSNKSSSGGSRTTTASSSATAAEATGKESKWQLHHRNIDRVLNETFPTVRESAATRRASERRQRLLEEQRVHMTAAAPLSLSATRGDASSARKRTRFEDKEDDDEDDDDYDDVSELGHDSEDDEAALQRLEVSAGRVDSRRKRRLVPDMATLTTQELVRQQRKQTLQHNRDVRAARGKDGKKTTKSNNNKKDATAFEEVPIALTDPEVRARTLAIAQKMLDGKARRDILDASVNRYVFNDDEDLPDWFVKDEQRNCKVVLPVTAAEIEAQRARFRELNARPSKKVMEAVGRKRRRAERMMRGLAEKGKSDPRAREKASRLSVRKLMRSQAIKGASKKKNKPLDRKLMGQMRRDKQRMRRQRK